MPRIGETIGRFVLEHELGRGPMSEVYLGVERATGWKVAVKVFLIEPGSRPADHAHWANRMMREAGAAAAFQNEYVVRVHEVAAHAGMPYLVRDFIEGKSLAEFVADREKGAVERKVAWLRDLARTLAAIHRAGLVHRDVKPSNVLVRRDGALRLLDFGVARRSVDREAGLLGPTSDKLPSGTERLRVVGTPAYMAPERFSHQTTSPLADQFGWGVLAYELLAGHLPWVPSADVRADARDAKRLRPIRMIEAILTETPPPVRTFAPKLAPAFDAVVARTMAKAQEDRFPSMDDVLRAIDDALR
jgi:serine/threonine-protein kinase